MADEKKETGGTEDEGKAAESAKAKGSRKTLFIILAVVGVVLLAGVPVAIISLKGRGEVASGIAVQVPDSELHPQGKTADGEDEDLELEEGEEPIGAFSPMDPFVVNLKGGRFLRLQVQVEFVERDVPVRWTVRAPALRDAVVTLLTKKRAEDILADDGVQILKKDIREILNEALKKELVRNVLVTQIVVQ